MRGAALLVPLLGLAACAVEPGPDRTVSSADPPSPTVAQPAGPTPDCPIAGSSGWQAWVNAMPGPGRPKLIVVGKVQVPDEGYRVVLEAGPTREIHPPVQEAILRGTVPAVGAGTSLVEHAVRLEMPALDSYGAVVVRCGARVLATIDEVIRAQ